MRRQCRPLVGFYSSSAVGVGRIYVPLSPRAASRRCAVHRFKEVVLSLTSGWGASQWPPKRVEPKLTPMDRNSADRSCRERMQSPRCRRLAVDSWRLQKRNLHPPCVLLVPEWRSTAWPPTFRVLPQPHEKASSNSCSTSSLESRCHQADGAATCPPPLPRQVGEAAADPARVAPGRRRSRARPRSRSVLSAARVPVVLAVHDVGPLPDNLQAVPAEWHRPLKGTVDSGPRGTRDP